MALMRAAVGGRMSSTKMKMAFSGESLIRLLWARGQQTTNQYTTGNHGVGTGPDVRTRDHTHLNRVSLLTG